jgi:Multicopper oxidase
MSPSHARMSRCVAVRAIGAGGAWTAAVVGFFGIAAATKKEEPSINSLGGTEGLGNELDARGVDHSWRYNGTIPEPVTGASQSDWLRVNLKNHGTHPHSIHFHGVHPANQDGAFQSAAAGADQTYELTAKPFGVFPYHCHTEPADQHITRGPFGAMIIDLRNRDRPPRRWSWS